MAVRIQTDQTLYLYEAEGDTIFPATGSWSILWMYRHESDLDIASLLAVLYGDVAATIHCGTHVAADGATVTLRGANGGATTTAPGSFVLEVGREYRFSLIHNSGTGTVTFCNDGIPLLSMAFSPVAGTAGSRSLHFAGYGGPSAGSPPGNVDSTWARMRIWTAVLTEAEQKAEFRSLTPVRTSGLVNDWPMPAGSGRFNPASGTTQAIKIYPTTPLVDGTDLGTGPGELIYRSSNQGADSSLANSSISAPAPAGVTQGDLEVMWGFCGVLSPGTPPTMAAPAGWTRAGFGSPYSAAGGAVNVRGHLFYRIAPATNGAVVLNAGTNAIFVYSRSAYSNGNAAAPFGQVVFGSGGPSTSVVLSSLTTARARSLLSAFITQGSAQSITPPADMTERQDNAAAGVSLHDKNQLAVGASGTKTFALPASGDFGWGFAEFYSEQQTTRSAATSLAAAVTLARNATVGVAVAVREGRTTSTALALALRDSHTAQVQIVAAVNQVRAASMALGFGVQAAAQAGTSADAVVQRALDAAAAVDLAVSRAETAATAVSLQVQADAQASTSVDLMVQAGAAKSVGVSVLVQELRQAAQDVTLAVQQARTAALGLASAVQVARSASVGASLVALTEGNAGMSIDLQVQDGASAAAVLQAAVQFVAQAATAVRLAVAALASTSLSVQAAVALQFSMSAALRASVQAMQAAASAVSLYVLDPSNFARAPAGVGAQRTFINTARPRMSNTRRP